MDSLGLAPEEDSELELDVDDDDDDDDDEVLDTEDEESLSELSLASFLIETSEAIFGRLVGRVDWDKAAAEVGRLVMSCSGGIAELSLLVLLLMLLLRLDEPARVRSTGANGMALGVVSAALNGVAMDETEICFTLCVRNIVNLGPNLATGFESSSLQDIFGLRMYWGCKLERAKFT